MAAQSSTATTKNTPTDPRLRGSASGWIWFGFGGHFVLNYRCAFHLATYLPEKNLFVSTIGGYLPSDGKRVNGKLEFETIGSGDTDFYETFVYDSYGIGTDEMPSCARQRYGKRHADSLTAERHHYEVCWGLQDGTLNLDIDDAQ